MYKKITELIFSRDARALLNYIRMMKLAIALMIIACVQVHASSYAQKIMINARQMPVEDVFFAIQEQSGYDFIYDLELVKTIGPVSMVLKGATVEEALNQLLADKPVTYVIYKKTVTIMARPKEGTERKKDLTVSGKVVDKDGQAIPGVNIQIKGGAGGTSTKVDGTYSIDVPSENGVLIFSSIGYLKQEIPIHNQTSLNVTLLEDETSLNEVVITGYSTQSRHTLTSAIATVKGEDMTKRVATDPTALLQGQLPGLSAVQNSAEPGNEQVKLRIRGVGTFSGAGNDPLVIVDGIPGNLGVINPNDIESVTVLKDAAAAAIYGSRGANGVLVIKTKKGNPGALSLTYNYNIGFASPTRLPKLITNSAQYMELLNEAEVNSGNTPIYTQAQIDLYRNATDREKYPNYDWLDAMFKTAVIQNHYLNISGGSESTTYSLGLGYTDQPGTMRGFNYKKYTVNLGLNSQINKRVTLGTNFQLRYGDRKAPFTSATDLYISTLAQSPLYPPQTADGLWINKAYDRELGNKNPVLSSTILTQNPNYYGQGNISLDVQVFDWLKWENRAGINFTVDKNKTFAPVVPQYLWSDLSYYRNADVGTPGLTSNESDETHSTVYSQLNFHKTFGQHDLTILAGAQQEVDHVSNLGAFRMNYPTNQLEEIDAGSLSGARNNGTSADWVIHSFYGNANYSFNDKYLLGASLRYDGTSRLPSGSRWGLYESFSAGWRISEEAFLKDVTWIDDLKLRGSWGRLGNQNINLPNSQSPYPYQPALLQSIYAFNGAIANGFQANQLVDPALTWETTRMTDIGLDLTALQGKITFTFDWFNKYTYNILRQSQVPLALGVAAPIVNDGAVSNKGLEFSLHYQNKPSADFSYYATANFQLYRNKLVSFGAPQIGGPDNQTILQNGYPINSFYLYTMEGIFQNQQEIDNAPDQSSLGGVPTPGDIRYKDINGDGKVDANDRSVMPGQYPKFEYSYTMGATWKNWDVSVQLYGSYGNKLYLYKWGVDPFAQGAPPTVDWLDRWTPENPSTTLPKLYMGFNGYPKITNVQSTFHLYNASFLRIKNVQLGYTFSKGKVLGLQSLRIFSTIDNLAVFTPLKLGADPERQDINNRPDAWYGFAGYPQNRTYTFGASVQF